MAIWFKTSDKRLIPLDKVLGIDLPNRNNIYDKGGWVVWLDTRNGSYMNITNRDKDALEEYLRMEGNLVEAINDAKKPNR